MPAERTVKEVGIRFVPIRSGGYKKERVTVMLACTASDVVVAAHPNGWMDADGIIAWLDGTVNPHVNPRFGVRIRKVMLVLDSFRGHLTDVVKAKFGELNIVPAAIPAGCTFEIQPFDVAVNRSFEAAVRRLYQEWFESEGVDCLTERELTLKRISKAWKVVPKELIERSFLTGGIGIALDGSQDNLCMQHRRDAIKGEVELDDKIATDGFCCNNVEEPESDGEADQDGSATIDGDA
ncbi:unnamed protein product [Closterium sp. NIES-53]